MLDLKLIRYFVAVAEEGHVGRAAARLHISQSPLSRQIRLLEERLGLTLFIRSKQRIQLSRDGRAFLDEARALLGHAQRLEEHAREIAQGRSGQLRIGYVEGALHSGVLQTALREFCERYPRVQVETKSMRSFPQREQLLAGGLDVGFAYQPTSPHEELRSRPLLEEPFVLATPLNSPLADKRQLEPGDLDGQPLVALPAGLYPAARRQLLEDCASAGFTPHIRYETAEAIAALKLVEAGLANAFVQRSLCTDDSPHYVVHELPWFPARLSVHLVYRHDASPGAARAFVDLVGDLNQAPDARN